MHSPQFFSLLCGRLVQFLRDKSVPLFVWMGLNLAILILSLFYILIFNFCCAKMTSTGKSSTSQGFTALSNRVV